MNTPIAVIAIVVALALLGVLVLTLFDTMPEAKAVGKCPTPSRPSFRFNHTQQHC